MFRATIAPRHRKSAVKVSAPDIGATVRLCARQIRRPYANREFAPIISRQPLPAAAAARALPPPSRRLPPSAPLPPVRRAGTCLRACRKQDWRSPFAVARNKKCESIGAPSPEPVSVSLSLSASPYLRAEKSSEGPFRVRSGENNPSLGRPRGAL